MGVQLAATWRSGPDRTLHPLFKASMLGAVPSFPSKCDVPSSSVYPCLSICSSSQHDDCQAVVAVLILCMSTSILSGYVGATEDIPFGNTLHYSMVVTTFVAGRVFLIRTGLVHTYRPKEPHKTLLPQLLGTVIITSKALDCFSDMAFLRVLLHEVRFLNAMRSCARCSVQQSCENSL